MTLQPYHFKTPDKPKPEDYKVNHVRNSYTNHITIVFEGNFAYNETAFNQDLAEWESLYGEKPEPEWVSFDTEFPKGDGNVIILTRKDGEIGAYRYFIPKDIGYQPYVEVQKFSEKFDYWADKATYDTRLKQWESHQVRYHGWVKNEIEFQKNFWHIRFMEHETIIENSISNHFVRLPKECFTTELFEMICKEPEIELSKLQA